MRKITFLWLILGLFVISSSVVLTAQDDVNDDLRIAFVSNRLGNEDIYLMTQLGDQGPVSNLTTNPARDWNPAWSPSGDKIIFNSNRDGRDTLYTMDPDGNNVRALFPLEETFQDYDATWSPDGTQIVFVSDRAGPGREIYIADSDGSNVLPLTDDGTLKGDPIWSPDGQEIAYWQRQNETGEILLLRHHIETSEFQIITFEGPANGSTVWSGDAIYFDSNRRDGLWYIYSVIPDGSQVKRVSTEGFNSGRSSAAPDGSRLVFVSDRDENDEIYVMNADGSGVERLTDNRFSDHSPAWQPAVPVNQPFVEVAAEPTETDSEDEDDDLLGAALGMNANGVVAYPITMEQLLIDYGISAWHEAGWTGAGQRIGVIDLSFGGVEEFSNNMSNTELPPMLGHEISNYTDELDDHGTKVLRVIHAIAPNANLFACRYNGQLSKLQECVDWMESKDVDIINHSVGIPILPINGEHDWAKLVNETVSRGILWINSSGNFDAGYWDDNFTDSDEDDYHDFFIGTRRESGLRVPIEGSYSGTILISWDETNIQVINDAGIRERPNLDVEIISLLSGESLIDESLNRQQNVETNEPPAEIIPVNANEPFMIRVKNNGGELRQPMRFMIFVEFAPLGLQQTNTRSIVAPADARDSLTVGSVNANREVGSYSSRGDIARDYNKPDIAAPGEIRFSDDEIFIGTSAAAPVIAGIAALLLEEDPTLRTDQVLREMQSTWIRRQESIALGKGIIQLGAPPSSRIGDVVVDTPPRTVFPLPEELADTRNLACATLLPTRFEVGVPGYVNLDFGLAMRNAPNTEAAQIANLDFGTRFDVIGGPECASGMYWWLIELGTGAEGWVGEGFDFYLIAPRSLERARYPIEFETVCPSAPDPLIQIGDHARTLRGGLFFFRGLRIHGSRDQMDPLPANTLVEVLGGPVCEGTANNVLRWYVRVIEGHRAGDEGWTAEGITDERHMSPLSARVDTDIVEADPPPIESLPGGETSGDSSSDGGEREQVECTPLVTSRLEDGMAGYVLFDGLPLLTEPELSKPQRATLRIGDPFDVISDGVCNADILWANIRLRTGLEGWVAEGFNYYTVAPELLEDALYPETFDVDCPNAPPTQLEIGDQAQLARGGLFFFRGIESEGVRDQLEPLLGDTLVEILGGPTCEGIDSNQLRWYVRVADGPRAGVEGWLTEATADEGLMIPLSTGDDENIALEPAFAVAENQTCSPLIGSRFEVAMSGYVSYDLGLSIRPGPNTDSGEITKLSFGQEFEVIDGPECESNLNWWKVKLANGDEGWVTEGYDFYLIAPTSLDDAIYPVTFDTDCPNALESQLVIRYKALVQLDNIFFFRDIDSSMQMQPVKIDSLVDILGGPVCQGTGDNLLRWYVRVTEGPLAGYEGWLAEATADEYILIPVVGIE